MRRRSSTRVWLLVIVAVSMAGSSALPLAYASSDAPATSSVVRRAAPQRLQFSSHALRRMAERGVSRERVLQLVETATPFRYFHQGQWKTGYFDATSGLFVATAGGVVITVFTDATERYVQKLKRAKP